MKIDILAGLVVVGGGVIVASGGCSSRGTPTSSSVGTQGAYDVTIVASGFLGLPRCTSSLQGTVAFVSSPPSLWDCIVGTWIPISCNALNAGSLAYVSSTKTLLVCTASTWTTVALPQGPQGPQGPAGLPGSPGSQVQVTQLPVGNSTCSEGGARIDVGEIVDGGFVIQQTAFVCSGEPEDATSPEDAQQKAQDAEQKQPPDAGQKSPPDAGQKSPPEGGGD